MHRREFIGSAAAGLLILQGCRHMDELAPNAELYGLIGQMKAQPGKRDELIAILAEATGKMPGNLSYMISRDQADPDAIWIVEVWKDQESHQASLKLPRVQAAIAKGRPLIAGFGTRTEVSPAAGVH